MNDADVDEIGIRITLPNLVYSSNAVSRWFGAGILSKPISDLITRDNDTITILSGQGVPYFAGTTRIEIHGRVIPEPEEYALVFALLCWVFASL